MPLETQKRIRSFMDDRVEVHDKPLVLAKRLSGAYEDEIRYRVGTYRVICKINGKLLLILVIEVAHRREIYR